MLCFLKVNEVKMISINTQFNYYYLVITQCTFKNQVRFEVIWQYMMSFVCQVFVSLKPWCSVQCSLQEHRNGENSLSSAKVSTVAVILFKKQLYHV